MFTTASVPGNDYYSGVNTSSASALRASLHAIIDDHQRFPYSSSATDTWDVLEFADEDPLNPGRILDVYRNASYQKYGAGNTEYNREHTWPKSYGFTADSSSNYPYTDTHMLFLSDSGYNSSRGNKPYANCLSGCTERTTVAHNGEGGGSGVFPGNSNWYDTTYWQTWGDRKGDVARALLYMDVRYEGGTHGVTGAAEPDLILTDDPGLIQSSSSNLSVAYMGRLADLLQWHAEDPVDAKEQLRNEAVYSYQGNRNPFIDHPEWAACIFQNQCN
jgi:endonuclease I